MTEQLITLQLPLATYEKVKQAAAKTQRSLEQVLLEAVTAVATVTSPPHIQTDLASLAYLNDAALWQMARSSMLPNQQEALANLHHKQQSEGLSTEEQAQEEALRQLYQESILIRAQAAVLLKQRGYDVSDPSQFLPLQ